MKISSNFDCYFFGEFVAKLMLNGQIQPDLHLNNVGIRENTNELVLVDFAPLFSRKERRSFEKIIDEDKCDITEQCKGVYMHPDYNSRETYYAEDEKNFRLAEDAKGNIIDEEKESAYARKNAVLKEIGKKYKKTIPDDLSEDTVKGLTTMLFSPLEDLDSFIKKSYFRAGFTAYGGLLGHTIFLNIANFGISGLSLADIKPIKFSYDSSDLYKKENTTKMIAEWKTFPLSNTFDLQTQSPEQLFMTCNNFTEVYNKFYLYILYFLRIYIYGQKEGLHERTDIAIQALSYLYRLLGYRCISYGLEKRCNIISGNKGNTVIQAESFINKETINYINNIVEKYDFIELLWILNELDQLADGNINNIKKR